jgi:protein-tyrosine phosphatase
MRRIDTHHHLLPALDDGCRDLADVQANLALLAQAGFDRVFCTPHCLHPDFGHPTNDAISARVAALRQTLQERGIPIALLPGGELRLDADMVAQLRATGIPTYGMAGRHVLVETWEPRWHPWATRAIEWLQKQGRGGGLTVILAHPERMKPIQEDPTLADELQRMGVLFQGTLGPIAGTEFPKSAELGARFLREGRYFMLATDAHRPEPLPGRLAGLETARQIVGAAALTELTVTNPGQVWDAATS